MSHKFILAANVSHDDNRSFGARSPRNCFRHRQINRWTWRRSGECRQLPQCGRVPLSDLGPTSGLDIGDWAPKLGCSDHQTWERLSGCCPIWGRSGAGIQVKTMACGAGAGGCVQDKVCVAIGGVTCWPSCTRVRKPRKGEAQRLPLISCACANETDYQDTVEP